MENKKVFISQPMRGLTYEQIIQKRKKVVEYLENEGYIVVDSVFKNAPENSNSAVWCLGESLKLISQVDAVYFMDEWQTARGCKIEREVCKTYGIDIIN